MFYAIIIMGYFTLLYEFERNNIESLILVILIIIGIMGVLCIYEDKKIHYLYAAIIVFSILGFMINHCYLTNCNFLHLIFYVNLILLGVIIVNIKGNIFYSSIFYNKLCHLLFISSFPYLNTIIIYNNNFFF